MAKALIAARAETSLDPWPDADASLSDRRPAKGAFDRIRAAAARYVQLSKPGIVFGNLVSTTGGFLLAARGSLNPPLLLATLAGVSLVVASGCAFNNVIDRDIDAAMKRTRGRALARGAVLPGAALVYAVLLAVAGFVVLANAVSGLAVALAAAGFAVYVGVYSLCLKRRSPLSTVVGSLSGATPPVIGYCAASGRLDAGALLLLLIFCLWQMPHSYAIGILYRDDYAAAGVPILPVRCGVATAKRRILAYIVAFVLAATGLTLAGYAGYAFLAASLAMGGWWLHIGLAGWRTSDDRAWARRMFSFSIVVITTLSLMMGCGYRL
jgi:protoheme IX farnesyltransferase